MQRQTKLVIALAVASLLLTGQVLSEIGDPYLAVEDGRPVTPQQQVITLRAWGLIEGYSDSVRVDCQDEGLADMRLSASTTQVLTSVATVGFLRPMTITYRCHAGNAPVGAD